MELEFSRQILEEYSNIKLRENPSSGTDGRTDRTKVLRTRLKTSKAQWSIYVPYSGHYMYRQFNIQQFYVLPTHCIYVFCVDLRTNSDYFPIQH